MTNSSVTSTSLSRLLRERKEELLVAWRKTVRLMEVARTLDTSQIDDHIGKLLEEMAFELERGGEDSVLEAGGPRSLGQIPRIHGKERLNLGFDLEEIVYEYNALRSAILNLAETHQVSLLGSPGQIVNRVLDTAIGTAVKTYASQQAEETRQRRNEHLAFIVHDLRSPLSAISLAATVLRRQDESLTASEQLELLEIIEANARKLERQTQQILVEDASLRDGGGKVIDCSWVNLHKLVTELVSELKPLGERSRVQLEVSIDQGLKAYVDASRVALIFQNLLSNAIRYTVGGTVTISCARSADGIECCVADTGMGIAPDRLEKIFQRGESDDPDGFGLGLPIVKTLVRAHQGKIRVESRLGEGSRFFISFPHPGGSDHWEET